MGVMVVAGDKGVPALDLVRKSLAQKEIQRAVDGDRSRAPSPLVGDMLNQIISSERLLAGRKQFQHPRPHWRQPLAALGAKPFGALEHRAVVVMMSLGHGRYVTMFRRFATRYPRAAIAAQPVRVTWSAVMRTVAMPDTSFSCGRLASNAARNASTSIRSRVFIRTPPPI